MKKLILIMCALIYGCTFLSAQNIQLHYDLGRTLYKGSKTKNLDYRPVLTSTIEMLKPDRWGSTFFFVDMDYAQISKTEGGMVNVYGEISRELKFWSLPLSIHLEYNGGFNKVFTYNNAWLAGLTWTWANSDFSKVVLITPMYKYIPLDPKHKSNFQLTGVWNLNFFNKKLTLSGFADFWSQTSPWGTNLVFMSEPQIWYNLNTIKGWEGINLSIGSETEISMNLFAKGWYAIPTIALKWTFN